MTSMGCFQLHYLHVFFQPWSQAHVCVSCKSLFFVELTEKTSQR